jgi:DNA-binding response OmpR family regulator
MAEGQTHMNPGTLRILQVEDHHDTAASMGMLLTMAGHTVATAAGFDAALQLAKAQAL